MWNLFVILLAAYAIGLIILYGFKYLQDTKGFDFWFNLGHFLLRLFIGAVFSLIISLCYRYPWVTWVAMAAVGFLSNYWMKWLDRRKGS